MIRKITLLSFYHRCLFIVHFAINVTSIYLILIILRLSLNNAVEERPVFPNRGLIYDRNGILLVKNQPAYDLMVIPENQESFDTLELTSVLNISKQDLITQLKKAERFSNKHPSEIIRQVSKETRAFFQEKNVEISGILFSKKDR